MNPIIEQDTDRILESLGALSEELEGAAVLITGPYGMLASYLLWTLIRMNETKYADEQDRQIRIIAAGRNEKKLRDRFGAYADRPYFTFFKTDLLSPLCVDGPVDFIIHAASHASPDWYSRDPVGVTLPNMLGTKNLLDLAVQKKSRSLLFFSSGEIYGKTDIPVITEKDGGFLDPAAVRSCYG